MKSPYLKTLPAMRSFPDVLFVEIPWLVFKLPYFRPLVFTFEKLLEVCLLLAWTIPSEITATNSMTEGNKKFTRIFGFISF